MDEISSRKSNLYRSDLKLDWSWNKAFWTLSKKNASQEFVTPLKIFQEKQHLNNMVDSIPSNSNLNYIPLPFDKFNNLIFIRLVVRRKIGKTELGGT